MRQEESQKPEDKLMQASGSGDGEKYMDLGLILEVQATGFL